MLVEKMSRFFLDFSVAAVIGNREIRVVFDESSDPLNLGSEGREITALAITSEVADLRHQDTLTIEGKTYEVVGINREMDGKLTELVLKE